MTRFLLTGAAALAMMTGAAMAQTTTSETTTTSTSTVSPPVAPVTITNSQTTGSAVTADGVKTSTTGLGARDSTGQAAETTVSTRTYPLTDLVTTTKKTVETKNGVGMETVTTTQAYPASPARPAPVVTTTSETHPVVK
jgi:hypothetical protein